MLLCYERSSEDRRSEKVVSAEEKGGPLDMKETVDRVRLRFVTTMRSRVLFLFLFLLFDSSLGFY